jgi:hypothetical protein
MNVPVAGVENVRDAQIVLLARGADELHHFGKFRARHDAIFSE